jgi:3-oxoacyl-[acyl-carrier protein] reductase
VNRYQHHVVHITGGARGLDAAMAHRFAAEDAVAIGNINEDLANTRALSSTNGESGLGSR